MLSSRFEQALTYAVQVHRGQLRKGSTIPYLAHLLAVAAIVLEEGAGEDEAIAALLHDAAEDRGGRERLKDIAVRFGTRVAGIVEECSDSLAEPKEPWLERKRRYLANLEHASPAAVRISLADKLHNLRSLLRDFRAIGEEVWERFDPDSDQLAYYRRLVEVLARRTASPLVDELDRTLVVLENEVKTAAHPIEGAYWVVPGRLLVGEYPGAVGERQSRQALRRLGWSGVNAYLDLTEEGEYGVEPYAPWLDAGTTYQRLAIPDRGVPDVEGMKLRLDALDHALGQGRTVYLHCLGGIGRTGTVVGCWLVRHGMDPEAALATIAERRQGVPEGYRPSPETPVQRRMVETWETDR